MVVKIRNERVIYDSLGNPIATVNSGQLVTTIKDSSGTEQYGLSSQLSTNAIADNISAVSSGIFNRNMGFNGSTWDRLRSVNTGQLVVTIKDPTGDQMQITNRAISGTSSSGTDAILTQSVIAGVDVAGTTISSVKLDSNKALLASPNIDGAAQYGLSAQATVTNNRVQVDNNNPLSSFGDLITHEFTPILQYAFEYDMVNNTELWSTSTTGSGTTTTSNAMAVIASGTTAASDEELKSVRHARYRSGMGSKLRFTALWSTGVTGGHQIIGVFDEAGSTAIYKNGYGIGKIEDTMYIFRYDNDTDQKVALSACDDPLDGNGASGFTLDTTKLNVFEIDFAYLGAGPIQFKVFVSSLGKFVVFHTINISNVETTPHSHNPNFHIIVKVDNGATTTDVYLHTASIAYGHDGKSKYYELHQPQQSVPTSQKTTVTTEVAIWTIKNKTTYTSVTNFIDIIIERINVSVEASAANNLAKWRLVQNATLGGSPSYADINTTDSVVEYDTAGTTVTGGKALVYGDLAGKNDKERENLLDYEIILKPGDTLTMAVQSANSATFNSSGLWKELF